MIPCGRACSNHLELSAEQFRLWQDDYRLANELDGRTL